MNGTYLRILSILFTVIALLVHAAAHAKTITIAYPSPSWKTSLPVSTARDFGIFAAEGLDVRPVYVRGGPVVMAALLSGEADYAIMAERFSFPTAVLFVEEEEKRFGKNSWLHGLDPNRRVLTKFVEYAKDQGYIPYQPALDDIFAPLAD